MNKRNLLFVFALLGAIVFTNCSKDDDENKCVTCINSVDNYTVCELDNGNAEVDGFDTQLPFDLYIADFESKSGTCN